MTGSKRARLRRWVLIAAATLAVLAVTAHLAMNTAMVRYAIRGKIAKELTRRFPNSVLGERLEVDLLGRVTFGPLEIASSPTTAPFLTADEIRVRPSYTALLKGKVLPASVWLGEVHVGRPTRPSSEKSAEPPPPKPPDSGGGGMLSSLTSLSVSIDQLYLHPRDVSGPALLAPIELRFAANREEGQPISASAWATFVDGGRARFRLDFQRDRRVIARVELRGVGTGVLSDDFLKRIPVTTLHGGVSLDAQLGSDDGGKTFVMDWKFHADELEIANARLAVRPLGPLSAGFEGKARVDVEHRRVGIEDAEAWLGAARLVRVKLTADIHDDEEPSMIEIRANRVSYRELIEALPDELRPGDDAPSCGGPINAFVSLKGPLRNKAEWEFDASLDITQVRSAYKAPRPFLLDPFEYTAITGRSQPRTIWVGPPNDNYVPISELPPYMPKTILVSEDAAFFIHRGFDVEEIKNAVNRAFRTPEERMRGASTITQQLTKNLFLTRERTYARKAREALITVALEATIPKERLLEVYLNVIEWGPNVYGIGEAAKYYFGVDARQLSPKQAAFLATIIPNPIRYHVFYEQGALSKEWNRHVRAVLARMYKNDYLTFREYAPALSERLEFRHDEPSAP